MPKSAKKTRSGDRAQRHCKKRIVAVFIALPEPVRVRLELERYAYMLNLYSRIPEAQPQEYEYCIPHVEACDIARMRTHSRSMYSQLVYIQRGKRAHTHRELIREWLWEPKGSSLKNIVTPPSVVKFLWGMFIWGFGVLFLSCVCVSVLGCCSLSVCV